MSIETDRPHNDHSGKSLVALDVRAYEQRQNLLGLVDQTRERLRPDNLMQEAGNRLLDIGLDTIDKAKEGARRHPIKATAAVAAIGIILARKPLLRLCCQGYASLRQSAETEADPEKPAQAQAKTSRRENLITDDQSPSPSIATEVENG